MKAIVVHQHGGPEALQWEEVAAPANRDEVLVEVAWAGVNFVDIYQREGRYPNLTLPLTPGIEAAGIVREAPAGSRWQPGQRVAFAGTGKAAYAEHTRVAADGLVAVPDHISLRDAAAVLEHALTATMLIDWVARLPQGSDDWAVVHAAAGGVGSWLTRTLLARGIPVAGIVSTTEKAACVNGWGAKAVVNLNDTQLPAAVHEATRGKAPRWVFDSVGAATFDASLAMLAPCGHLVLYGAASGQVPPVDPVRLMVKSATLTRPMLNHYLQDPVRLAAAAAQAFQTLAQHPDWLSIHAELPLSQASEAHRLFVSRSRMGKVLLKGSGL